MKKKIAPIIIICLILILAGVLDGVANFVVNIKWFNEVGYLSVLLTKIFAVLKLMIPIFLVCFFSIWLYYRSLRKNIFQLRVKSSSNENMGKSKLKIFIIFDVVISFIISFSFASTYWYRILQFNNAVSFHKKDPIFNLDISFYVFRLPLIESLYSVFMNLLVLLVVFTLILYGILNIKSRISSGDFPKSIRDINIGNSGLRKFAGKQLAVVSSLIILLLSLGYVIKSWNLVYSTKGVVFGGGYTDVKITLLFYRILIGACILSAIIIFVSVLAGKLKPIIVSICTIIGLIFINIAVSFLVQNFIVKSNEKNLETKYIKYNIDFTRKAFNVNSVDSKPFNVSNDLTKEDLVLNKDTIDNIKVNSYAQALEFYNQTQVMKYYYKFNDLDVDRYNINGKGTQVFLAPREIDIKSLEGKANTWANKHLVYTHGYGIVMNNVNSVTSEGKPDFVIKDIPPNNSTDLQISDPRIYFGEKTNSYAVVDNTLGELDYPNGSGNKTYNYKGNAGIKMTGINKVLFSIYEKDLSFLLSKNITGNSKIMINRNISGRIKKIAPFLTYDKDPYIVLSNGKLYWIIDAYTTTNQYPYSQPYNGINYIRNSVKVVVDAENGDTNFYIVDKNDPIAKSYSKIFPHLFKSLEKAPVDIKQHFRYPEDMFKIQCNVMGKYHVTDSSVFYNGDDLWQIAQNQKQIGGDKTPNEAAYVYMKLPNENKEEMVLIDYFNVIKNNNIMISLFGARMDADNYGKLVLYRFPSTNSLTSPLMFKQNLNQDTTISSQLSLWNKEGSQVLFGDTIILPIKNSLLYVEPIYLRASGDSSIPEMKRVVVSYGDKTVLAENISTALTQIFNFSPINAESNKENTSNTNQTPAIDNSKFKDAKDLYDKALDAQKSGDWAKYGDYINQLGKLLNETSK